MSEMKPHRKISEDTLALDVGRRLRWLREISGRTQAQCADAAGCDQSEWSRWEKGTRMADPAIMAAVCLRMRVSMDYIYRGLLVGVHPDLAEELFRQHPAELVAPPMNTGWGKGKAPP